MRFFITGTDTGIGKTYVSLALLKWFKEKKITALAIKPIAAGATIINGKLCNEDALLLQNANPIYLPYSTVNPFVFEHAVAPHIAAFCQQEKLKLDKVASNCQQIFKQQRATWLVEGAGGWCVPLNKQESMTDLAGKLGCQAIMVVGMRLGVLNHALLTYQAIVDTGVTVAGWVANCLDNNFSFIDENINFLEQKIGANLLAIMPYKGKRLIDINLSLLFNGNIT